MLFKKLSAKVAEAYLIEANESKVFENMPESQAKETKEKIKQHFKLAVMVSGIKGEHLSGDEESVFNDQSFPDNIKQIVFDSSFIFRSMTGQEPLNKLEIKFDFKKQDIFDFSNPIINPKINESSITVQGVNETWVSGVYADIISFFENKKKKRNWLYKKYFYELFLYIVFYPISFWWIYRVSSLLYKKINIVLLIAICFYVFTVILYILRIFFNYTRWIFPLLEFIPESGTKITKHRGILAVIIIGIISSVIYDIIKFLF